MAKNKQAKRASRHVPLPGSKILTNYRREIVLLEIENMIAEQREPAEIDRAIIKKHGVSAPTAVQLRDEALRALLGADESNRRERFKLVLRALRRLYVAAFDNKQLTVCANLLNQMREMFDLKVPFIEGGGKVSNELDSRTVDDLNHFAETGEWPEETAKRKAAEPAVTNPLDELV